MSAANRRYLEFLSALDDPTSDIKDLDRILPASPRGQRTHRGFNLFDGEDRAVFEAKKIGCTYRYYLTQFGQRVICAALKRRRLFLIPGLAREALA